MTTTKKHCEYHGEAPHQMSEYPLYIDDEGRVTDWETYWECAKCEWEKENYTALAVGADIDYPEWWND